MNNLSDQLKKSNLCQVGFMAFQQQQKQPNCQQKENINNQNLEKQKTQLPQLKDHNNQIYKQFQFEMDQKNNLKQNRDFNINQDNQKFDKQNPILRQRQDNNNQKKIEENNENQNKGNTQKNHQTSNSFQNKFEYFSKKINEFKEDVDSYLNLSQSEKTQIDPLKLKDLFDSHQVNIKQLLNSSQNKDITIMLGPTGSGKSTLANILCGIKLKALKGNLLLESCSDNKTFKIGHGNDSQTLLPQVMHTQGVNIYDLAGFHDSRGTEYSFLNAAFIKNILLQAKSVKIIFVVDYYSLTAERGQIFLHFVNSYGKQLIPECNIVESSLLVVTKVEQQSQEEFEEEMFQKLKPLSGQDQHPFIQALINRKAILKISKPYKSETQIDLKIEKDLIWDKLNSTQGICIKNVNTCAIFTSDESKAVQDLCNHEILIILKNIFKNFNPTYPLNDEQQVTLTQQINAVNQFKIDFENQIESNTLIKLLKNYSDNIFKQYQQSHMNNALRLLKSLKLIIEQMQDQYQQSQQVEQKYEKYDQQLKFLLQQQSIKDQQIEKLMQEQKENLDQQKREKNEKIQKEKEEELKKKFPIQEGTYRIQCCQDDQYLFSTNFDTFDGNRVLESHKGRGDSVFYVKKHQEMGYVIKSCSNNGEYISIWEDQYQGYSPFILCSDVSDYKPTVFLLEKQEDGSYFVTPTHKKNYYWITTPRITKLFNKVVVLGQYPMKFYFRPI